MSSKNTITFVILILSIVALLGFLVWSSNSASTPADPVMTRSEQAANSNQNGTYSNSGVLGNTQTNNNTQPNTNLENQEDAMSNQSTGAPEMTLDKSKQYSAVIRTSKGDITVDLYEDAAPITVNNFVHLAETGFYDGTIFHRVIDEFMIQGGDPTGTGTGNPGYSFEDEFNNYKLVRGSLAMANSGPDTNGSQFFIVTAESTPWLDGKHTNFGRVTGGMSIVDEILKVETDPRDKPLEKITVDSIEIIAN